MENKYVWYVGYGSNLNKQRFLCYILGGKPTYGQISKNGCADKTLPLEDKTYRIPYEIYFALPGNIKNTPNWGIGGVAFLRNTESKNFSLGRMWKVTKNQYKEVRKQEGEKWYDRQIFLGMEEDIPIYTITNSRDLNNILPPAIPYLKTLVEGLKESYNMTLEEIADYLIEQDGVKGRFQVKDLLMI